LSFSLSAVKRRMNEWVPEAEVIAATGASRRNLKFWRSKGLLPKVPDPAVQVRRLGKAHGIAPIEYRPWAIPIIRRIMTFMAVRGRKLDACLWALWLDEDLPPEATAWLGQRVAAWSERLLLGANRAVDTAGPAETRNRFKYKPRRNAPPMLRQIFRRLDTSQWYEFTSALAARASRRPYTPTPSFLAASSRLGVPLEAVLPPAGTQSVFDGVDPHDVIASAKPGEIAAARELWLRHFGSFDRPAIEPPPDWAAALLNDDWRDFLLACPALLAGLICAVRDGAIAVEGAP
jgi:hypothetical protein